MRRDHWQPGILLKDKDDDSTYGGFVILPDASFVGLGPGFDGVPCFEVAVVLGAAFAVDRGEAGVEEFLGNVFFL